MAELAPLKCYKWYPKDSGLTLKRGGWFETQSLYSLIRSIEARFLKTTAKNSQYALYDTRYSFFQQFKQDLIGRPTSLS